MPGVKCPNCRRDVPKGSRFCLNCGGVLESASDATALDAGETVLDPNATTPISGAARPLRTPTPTPVSGSRSRSCFASWAAR